MEHKKKYIEVCVIGIIVLLLVGIVDIVVAQEVEIEETTMNIEGFNLISWFKHTFNIQDFSIIGKDRHCDVYAKKTIYYNRWDMMSVSADDYCSKSYGLIDVFDGNWNTIGEWKNNVGVICGDSDGCIVEIYCCPHDECDRDSDCEDWEGTGSECEISYKKDPYIDYKSGSTYKYCTSGCTGSDITCWREESGICVSRKYDCSYGTYPDCPTSYKYTSKSSCEANLCTSHSTSKCYSNDIYWYNSCGNREDKRTECGSAGCTTGTSSCNVALTCNQEGYSCGGHSGTQSGQPCCSGLDCQNFQCVVTGSCSSGETKCGIVGDPDTSGEVYYTCVDGTFVSQGKVDGKCGYTINENGVPINLNAVIYDIEAPTSIEKGKEVIVEFKVKNNGDTGNYLIETGIIPKSTAEDWGFKYAEGSFNIFYDWLNVQTNTECCEGQPNIFAKTTQLKSGEIDTFKIKIPKAPYSEIADLCYDNLYWNGTGEYVLYITIKTGCWPEGKEVTYETKIINVKSDVTNGNGATTNGEEGVITLTWNEFYSTPNDEISFFGIFADSPLCFENSECPLIEGYDVYCDKSDLIQKRIYEGRKEYCKDKLELGGIIGFAQRISQFISGVDFCEVTISGYSGVENLFNSKPGMCIAKSTTWYGKLWDSALKMVGGMGLPAQYVSLITIMFILTLIGIIIKVIIP